MRKAAFEVHFTSGAAFFYVLQLHSREHISLIRNASASPLLATKTRPTTHFLTTPQNKIYAKVSPLCAPKPNLSLYL